MGGLKCELCFSANPKGFSSMVFSGQEEAWKLNFKFEWCFTFRIRRPSSQFFLIMFMFYIQEKPTELYLTLACMFLILRGEVVYIPFNAHSFLFPTYLVLLLVDVWLGHHLPGPF